MAIALFAALAIDAWHARPDPVTLGLADGCVALASVLSPDQLLLLAVATFAATLIVRHHLHRSRDTSASQATTTPTSDRSAL